jgi:hypothetical protein
LPNLDFVGSKIAVGSSNLRAQHPEAANHLFILPSQSTGSMASVTLHRRGVGSLKDISM